MPFIVPLARPSPTRRAYPSDLTDAEWVLIEPLLPETRERGQPRIHSYREILNAIFYYLAEGCRWRSLPHDLPPWQTVATYFYRWRDRGLLDAIHTALRETCREVVAEREAEPTAAILDSQTVKTSNLADEAGFDGGKKNQGAQTPPLGRHRGPGAGRLRLDSRADGCGRRGCAAGGGTPDLPALGVHLGG